MSGKDRRQSERVPTASIPIQLSDVDAELTDLSLTGAAAVHRSPVRGGEATLVFPSHGGFYIPCQILRSVTQVRRSEQGAEYVFRSAIHFNPIPPEQQPAFHEFLQIQMRRLEEKRAEVQRLSEE
ncbi:MAG TPA: PilZ domain-containing protein [Thermoanaerobaculia bacterium]|nr:PilZ domain-containing protein [Thermoanaerobaculia bacterium]